MQNLKLYLLSVSSVILLYLNNHCTVEAAEIKQEQITATIKNQDSLSVQTERDVLFERTQTFAHKALETIKTKGYNPKFCLLLDMSIHSGKNRFFVYNFEKDTLIHQGLVAHGCCDKPWGTDSTKLSPRFSNVENSHCSSLGKYKIGKRGYSDWGIHVNYKLHGLDSTNSNAYQRFIVLHSWNAVSKQENYPRGTPEGWGCPAIENSLMKEVDSLLKTSEAPTLLWIYN